MRVRLDEICYSKIKVNDKWLINEYNRVEVDCIFVKINIRRIELEKEMELVIIGR